MKNVAQLRQTLSDAIDRLMSGDMTVQQAQTIINAVGKILHSIHLQLQYAKLKGRASQLDIPLLDIG